MKYRDRVPLTENDFAEIRANVMARVKRRRFAAWPWAFAAAAVLIAILVAGPRRQQPTAGHASVVARAFPAEPAPVKTTPQSHIARRTRPHRARRNRESQSVVVHLQTANPDVRIIWITSKESL
jgi:hypothetical protein